MLQGNLSEAEKLILKSKKLDGYNSNTSVYQTFAIGVGYWSTIRESARKRWVMVKEMKRKNFNMGHG